MPGRRDRRGRRIPLGYLTAVAVAAGAAGDDSPEGAAAWAASAPDRVLHRLGAPRDAAGRPRRPDAATFSRVLGDPSHAQQAGDALCAWAAARARDLRPGARRHLRVDGKALRGAARGGHAPMLLSGLRDDGTTAAQLPVNTRKTNEIPVFRDLPGKIPPGDLKDAVISADQMHTQRGHAEKIAAAGAFFIFTIGDNQEKLSDAADELPWGAFAGEAWTAARGHGRTGARPRRRVQGGRAPRRRRAPGVRRDPQRRRRRLPPPRRPGHRGATPRQQARSLPAALPAPRPRGPPAVTRLTPGRDASETKAAAAVRHRITATLQPAQIGKAPLVSYARSDFAAP